MTQQRHVIKQQILELHISSGTNAFEMQNQISALYHSQIIPLIEAICNQFSDPDTIHRIDRIEIDLGEIDAELLETDFVQKAAEALSMQLSQIFTATTVQPTEPIPQTIPDAALSQSLEQARQSSPTSPAQARFELFCEFVQTGRLPWWSKPLDRNGLEDCFSQLLADSPDKLKVLLQNGLRQEKIMQRIFYQFSEPMLMEMLKLLAPALPPIFRAYLEDIQRLIPHVESFQKSGSQHLRQTIWQGLFLHLSLQRSFFSPTTKPEIDTVLRANLLHIAAQLSLNGRSLIQQLLTTIETLTLARNHFNSELPHVLTTFSLASDAPESSSEMSLRNGGAQGTNTEAIPPEQIPIVFSPSITDVNFGQVEDIYIQNAGVILLWPFLNRFLESLNLVKSGQFLSLQATHRATLFLQYLVEASLESLEATLPLNKLLCGLDISEPIPTNLVMTEDEQSECEVVLSAVIENWSALGNTSTAGLRQAFLQRTGVLRSHREGWLLQVEHQTHDILLNYLPWSIRVIKLPWMAQVLHTEW